MTLSPIATAVHSVLIWAVLAADAWSVWRTRRRRSPVFRRSSIPAILLALYYALVPRAGMTFEGALLLAAGEAAP